MGIRISVGNRTANSRTARRVDIDPLWHERGLAVHKAFDAKGWTITHTASGYAVLTTRTHRDAITVANRLLDAGDWTVARTNLNRRTLDRARDIVTEARLLGLVRK